MQEDKLLDLIRLYLNDDCSSEEKDIIENWLAEDQSHQEYFDTIKDVWEVTPSSDVEVDFEEEWHRMSTRLGINLDAPKNIASEEKVNTKSHPKINEHRPINYLLKVAAVILLIALPAYYFSTFNMISTSKKSSSKVAMQKIETAKGERASMQFSDGSKIMLNSMSSVRFPKVFSSGKREIYLEGEAFFRVIHNEDVPFIVHVNGVTVRDIGTEFNVNGYKEDGSVEVVVRNGQVAVKQDDYSKNNGNDSQSANSPHSTREVFLTKGQRTFVKSGQLPSKPENVSLKPYMAWVNGRMVFDGTPMREVIKRLERAYDLKFQVKDSTLLSEKLKASFKRETPEKVLGIIAFSLGIDYELHGSTVILKSK